MQYLVHMPVPGSPKYRYMCSCGHHWCQSHCMCHYCDRGWGHMDQVLLKLDKSQLHLHPQDYYLVTYWNIKMSWWSSCMSCQELTKMKVRSDCFSQSVFPVVMVISSKQYKLCTTYLLGHSVCLSTQHRIDRNTGCYRCRTQNTCRSHRG